MRLSRNSAKSILCLLINLTVFLSFTYASDEFTVCLFNITDISAEHTNIKYETIIRNILSVELENAGYRLNDQSQAMPDKKSLIQGAVAVELASGLGAQLALTGFYCVENQRITINLKCYDVEQKTNISSELRSGSLGLSIYNIVNRMIEDMLPGMKARYFVQESSTQLKAGNEIPGNNQETAFIESLTFFSDLEGMRIFLPGKVFLGELTENMLTTDLPFALHSKLIILKQKDGYHSQTEQIKIKKTIQENTLTPINKKNHYALEFNSAAGQLLGLGVGFRYYFNPDYFFSSAEDYFFVQHTLHADDKPVFHNDFKILAGHYLWDANALFRVAVSTGVGDILTIFSVSGMKPKNDIYWNVLNIHFELNFSDWSFYIRQELKYALGLGNNALGRKWLFLNEDIPVISAGILGKW